MTSSSSNRNGEKILTALLVVAALSPIFAQTRTTTRSTNPGQTINASSKTSTSVKNNTKNQTDARKATSTQTVQKSENTKQEQTGFDPAMYQLSARRTKLIQNAVISHAKTGDLNDPDTTKAILNEIKRQMPVTPSAPLKKTDAVAISMQVRKNVQKGQSASSPKTIEEIAEQKYPLYKIGDTVSFDYYMGSRRYSVKGKLIRITQKSITVDDKKINLIDLDPVEQSKFDSKINQQIRAKYIRTQSLIENRVSATEEQNSADRLIVQHFKDNENAGYIYNSEKDSWETAEEVATGYMNTIKSLQKNGIREALAAYDKKNDKRAVGIFSVLAKLDHPQAAYLSYTVYNLGKKASKSFHTTIQVDGKTISHDSISSVESHALQRMDNVSLGELSVGLHSITVTIDESTQDDYRVAERDILVLNPGTNLWSGSRTVENGENISDIYMQKGGTLSVTNAQVFDTILRGTARVLQGGVMSGTSVYNTGILQVNAGGTIDESLVSTNGTITVSSGGIARATCVESGGTLTVGSGGIAEDTKIGNGTVEVGNGGTARNVSVEAGGCLTVKSGGKVSGRLSAAKNASIVFQNGGIMDFNLSAFDNASTACVNLSLIEGTPSYTLTVSGKEKSGTYKLAEGAKGFDRTLGVKDTNGNAIGILDVKGEFTVGNAVYQLNLNKNTLTLKVIATDPPTVSKVKASITTPTVLDVVITAMFADDRGLAASLYKIGETGEWTPYEKKGVTVTKNATVFFKAVDNAGNESEIVSYEVTNIDKSVLDNGNDNWLLDPKQESPVNPLVRDSAPITISSGTKEILFDEDVSLSQDGRRNYVGAGDEADFLKIKLDSAAKLVFSLDVMDAAKFIVYRLIEGQDKKGNDTYSLKALQTTSLSPKKKADSITGTSKPLYLDSGEYYIAMRSSNAKKGGAAFYNVELSDEDSVFFSGGDNSDDWNDLRESGTDGAVGDAGLLDGTSDTVLDGWVGFGDTVDYAKITLEHAAKLNFLIDADGASKFTVWQLTYNAKKDTYALKSIKSISVKANVQAAVSVQLQASDENNMYYVSMAAANIKKFDSVNYHVGLDLESSLFYVDADNGDNNWLYQTKPKTRNMTLVDSEAVNITVDTNEIRLDQGGTEVIGWDNYVGFGDEADYLKIHLANDAILSFNVTATNAAQFVIYSLTEKPGKNGNPTYSLKAVQKTTIKPGKGQTEVSVPTKAISLSSGDYYISMLSTNAKTGAHAYYNVSLNTAECSGLPGEILNAQDACALLPNGNDDLSLGSALSSIQNPTAYNMAGVADLTLQQITFEEYNNSTLASL